MRTSVIHFVTSYGVIDVVSLCYLSVTWSWTSLAF